MLKCYGYIKLIDSHNHSGILAGSFGRVGLCFGPSIAFLLPLFWMGGWISGIKDQFSTTDVDLELVLSLARDEII